MENIDLSFFSFPQCSLTILSSTILCGGFIGCGPTPIEESEIEGGTTEINDGNLGGLGDSQGGINGSFGGGVVNGATAADWPGAASPDYAPDAPAGIEGLFAGVSAGAGCVTEPQDGTILPRNWLRPRFKMSGTVAGYMVVLSSSAMDNDLVGYGGPSGYKLKAEYWAGIASRAVSQPVQVTATIRATDGVNFSEAVSNFFIAPSDAGGALVYWASQQSQDNVAASWLEGFTVGEESAAVVLTPTDVQEGDIYEETGAIKANAATDWRDASGAEAGKPSCIGCHTSTPDGAAVAFNDGWPWAGLTASIQAETKGARATGVTEAGARLLKTPFIGTIAFSQAHWAEGNRKAISTFTPWMNGPYEGGRSISDAADLIWIDLEAPGDGVLCTDPNGAITGQQGSGWDYISRDGDPGAAVNPVWSNSGSLIAYASAQRVAGGHVGGIEGTTVPKTPDT
ncbi:MAG: hypothetical protein MK135_01660, partial [Polyangiaceae bacterium]|nr:hypothetical protein [Polyangiaceae bacterium]